MNLTIREAAPGDALECGRICYEAFKAIALEHNFPPDFASIEAAAGLIASMIGRPGIYGVVAELEGKIAGSNFQDERDPVAGIGPISIDPRAQNHGIGGRLMRAVIEHASSKGAPAIRLVQAGYHCRSLSLYAKLGFNVREHLSCMQGAAIGEAIPGYRVRTAVAGDLEACGLLCARVHGFARRAELSAAIRRGSATVVERAGRLTGYATALAYFAHAVAETNDDLQALIAAASAFEGPGILIPSRNGELMRWCLAKGLRVVQPLTLMTIGLYSEPAGAWLPSILY